MSSWCWFWSLYKLNAKEKAVCWFCGCEEDNDAELVCAARVWRGILDCILLLLHFYIYIFFFSNICDYIKEGPVLLLLFPSLSLSPLIGPLKYGVCVCCLVLFVLNGCYVVMLCVKKKKNVDKKKDKYPKNYLITVTWVVVIRYLHRCCWLTERRNSFSVSDTDCISCMPVFQYLRIEL